LGVKGRRGRLIAEELKKTIIETGIIYEKILGKSRIYNMLGTSLRTVQRWKNQIENQGNLSDMRSGSKRKVANKLSEEEKKQILEVCNFPEFRSLPVSQIVPILADRGQYIGSESSMHRVLREARQHEFRGRTAPPRVVEKPKGFTAEGPNQVWTWDITFMKSLIKGHFYKLYLIMDIFSRKIISWEIHEEENSELASELITKACLREGLALSEKPVLHSDNGSPMKGATMLATLQGLGIMPSFSRPSVSNDNPFSESLFKTLKYIPFYPSKPFGSITEAREWMLRFADWYNNRHHHSGINFVTPSQKHSGEDIAILENRKSVYEEAKKQHPERWSRHTRNWEPVREVKLNPSNEEKEQMKKAA